MTRRTNNNMVTTQPSQSRLSRNNNNNTHHGPTLDHQNEGNEADNLSSTIKRKPAPKVVGLTNLGNTCFMNAALQCLARTPTLLDRLLKLTQESVISVPKSSPNFLKQLNNNKNDEGKSQEKNEIKLHVEIPTDSMIYKMTELLSKMTSGGNTVTPSAVHNVVCNAFTAGMQHDSHELLRNIIDKMKKDQIRAIRKALLKAMGRSTKDARLIQEEDPKTAAMLKELDRTFCTRTVVDEVFGGQLMTIKTCLECNTVRSSFEDFLDLSLPLRVDEPNTATSSTSASSYSYSNSHMRNSWLQVPSKVNKTLMDCFRCFTEAETLAGSNKVDCEKCHEKKLNLVKSGVPIHEVFPPPPAKVVGLVALQQKNQRNYGNKRCPTNKDKKELKSKTEQKVETSVAPPPPPLPSNSNNQNSQKNPRRRKKKTRAEKIAEDEAAEKLKTGSTETTTATTTTTINEDDDDDGTAIVPSNEEEKNQEMSDPEKDNEGDQTEKNDATKNIESSSSLSDVPSDVDIPELEKVQDEGYAEDYKASDDSDQEQQKPTLMEENEYHNTKNEKESLSSEIKTENDLTNQSTVNNDSGDKKSEEDDDILNEDEDIADQDSKSDSTKETIADADKAESNTPKIPKSTQSACRRQTLISRPPNVLTIQLKRFTATVRGTTCKLSDFVQFPEYMNIQDFVTPPFINSENSETEKSTNNLNNNTINININNMDNSCDAGVNSSSFSHFDLNNENTMVIDDINGGNQSDACPISSWEFEESDEITTTTNEQEPDTVLGGGDTNEVEVDSRALVRPNSPLHSPQQSPRLTHHHQSQEDVNDDDDGVVGSESTLSKPIAINKHHHYADSESQDMPPEDFDYLNQDKDFDSHGDEVPMSPRMSPLLQSDTEQSPNDSCSVAMSMLQQSNISNDVGDDTNPISNDDGHHNISQSTSSSSKRMDIDQVHHHRHLESEETLTDILTPLTAESELNNSSSSPINICTPRETNQDNNDKLQQDFSSSPFSWNSHQTSNVWTYNYETETQLATDRWVQESTTGIIDGMETSSAHEDGDDSSSAFIPYDMNSLKSKEGCATESFGERDPIVGNGVPECWEFDMDQNNRLSNSDSTVKVNEPTGSGLYPFSVKNVKAMSTDDPNPTSPSYDNQDEVDEERPETPVPSNNEGGDTLKSNVIPLGYYPSMSMLSSSTSTCFPQVVENNDENKVLVDNEDDGKANTKTCSESLLNRFNEKVESPDGVCYRLYGIVEHSGNIHWGHYVAYVRADEEWYYISDSYVSKSKLSDVLSKSPYILFYERVL